MSIYNGREMQMRPAYHGQSREHAQAPSRTAARPTASVDGAEHQLAQEQGEP